MVACPAAADEPVPAAALELVGGGHARTDDYRGRVLVLNFWATWCAPCRAELAELDAYIAAHRGVAAVAVLAERRPDMRLVDARAATLRIPVALRIGGAAFPLANGAVPTTYILDPTGRVVLRRAGAFAPGDLSARLDGLIAPLGHGERGR